jgi:hypothetical protein
VFSFFYDSHLWYQVGGKGGTVESSHKIHELALAQIDKGFERGGQFGMLKRLYRMIESTTIALTGFEHLLGIASRAAGGDLAPSIDVKALEAQVVNGGSFVDLLLDQAELSERDLGSALADDLGLVWEEDPLVDEANADLLKAICTPPVAIKYRVLPLRAEFEVESSHPVMVELAHYDPVSSLDRQLVRRALNCPIVWKLAPRRKVLGGLQKLYGVGSSMTF